MQQRVIESIIQLQNQLLNLSPTIFPLIGIVYSLASSVHCTVMCGPFLPSSGKDSYFLGRLSSYTAAGVIFGGFGQSIRHSLEFEVIAAIGFVLFAFTTLMMIGVVQLEKRVVAIRKLLPQPKHSFWRGSLSVFIPCQLLYFFFALAVQSSTWLGGGLVLAGHALASMPLMIYGTRWTKLLSGKAAILRHFTKFAAVFLSVLSLAYFGARIFYSHDEAVNKLLFCF